FLNRCCARKNRPRRRGRLEANAGAAFAYGMTITPCASCVRAVERCANRCIRTSRIAGNHIVVNLITGALTIDAPACVVLSGTHRGSPAPDERAPPLATSVRTTRAGAPGAFDDPPARDLTADRTRAGARRHQRERRLRRGQERAGSQRGAGPAA